MVDTRNAQERNDTPRTGNAILDKGLELVAPLLDREKVQGAISAVKSFLGKGLASLGIDDFRKFGQQHGEAKFTNLLSEYEKSPEVQREVARVQKLVEEGVLSRDLGAAFIEKITGATQVANSRDHRCIVPVADAKRTLDLIESRWQEISRSGSGGDLSQAKAEMSLRIRLSFDEGGMAAINGETFDRDITTVISDKIFNTDALKATPDELWQQYRVRIMEMADASPENVATYLGQDGLKTNPAQWQDAMNDIREEQAVLHKLFGEYIEREKAKRVQETAAVYDTQTRTHVSGNKSGFDELLSFIAEGEGGYNSMNRGTSGGRIVGSTHNAREQLGRDLTDMTIGEIMGLQASGQLFASGRYQIIPDTMHVALKYSGLSRDDKFSPENQDKLAIALIAYKRPVINEYLQGSSSVSVDEAMLHLAMEWASMPDPRTGSSYYGHGNRALHSTEAVRAAMVKARQQISGK
jgi:hypothetical protein